MRARIVRIGNSRGVRLPNLLIEQAGLGQEVELRVQKEAILIQSAAKPRAGWAEAARRLAAKEGGGGESLGVGALTILRAMFEA
jgi:antitoxin MazE